MATLITLLNVAIGLAFVYLLLSLLVSTAVEMGAGMKNWRGIHLSAAISQLLDSTALPDLAKKVMGNALLCTYRPPSRTDRQGTRRENQCQSGLLNRTKSEQIQYLRQNIL